MITITPQGQVYLCKTPLENDYKNQLTFTNATNQLNYFTSKIDKNLSDEDFTYIKKDNTIKVGLPIDEIIDCNYLFYKNTGFTTKYYYCFITNMEYINENCTSITFETDVYQTYMFDIVNKACFVEREHVSDDTVGLHTIDEGLETGEYVIKGCNRVTTKLGAAAYIVAVNKYISGMGDMPSQSIYGNLFSGFVYLYFTSDTQVRNLIKAYNGYSQIDNIINIFTIGANMVNLSPTKHTIPTSPGVPYDIDVYYAEIPMSIRPYPIETNIQFILNNVLDGYIPKNNKMLCYPYNYLVVNNNAGNEVIYKYEEALNNTPTFNIEGVICPGGSVKMYPTNYKRYDAIVDPNDKHLYPKEYNYGITAGKMPNCSWSTDAYTNWLTQNAVNERYEDVRFGLSSFSNLPSESNPNFKTGGEIVENFFDMQLNRMQRRQNAEFIPNQTRGNTNAGDVAYSANILTFYASVMTVKYEYAKIIDDFLSMYGYKVNAVKQPNLTGRLNWNYVKTIGCNFEGDIPQVYLNKIKQIFNSGITLWHNASTFLDYSQSNTIVS